jgi:hypothetical protein
VRRATEPPIRTVSPWDGASTVAGYSVMTQPLPPGPCNATFTAGNARGDGAASPSRAARARAAWYLGEKTPPSKRMTVRALRSSSPRTSR